MTRIFYDIDTQNDFMNANGKLYVPGAESIKTNIMKLTDHARKMKVPIVGSVDAHVIGDPDFKSFPEHCVVGTFGQEKFYKPLVTEIFFEKQSYDVFTNPDFAIYLIGGGITDAIVYGVATDFCVKAAVLGMQKMGIRCIVVGDAIKGISPETTLSALREMRAWGANFITTEGILNGLV